MLLRLEEVFRWGLSGGGGQTLVSDLAGEPGKNL